jgi:hypothetical protein
MSRQPIWVCILSLCCIPPLCAQQAQRRSAIDVKSFEAALSIVFPPREDAPVSRYTLALTYLPSFHPETQIILRSDLSSHAEAVYQTLRVPLMATLKDFGSRNQQYDSSTLIAATGFRRAVNAVPYERMSSWLRDLLDSMARSASLVGERTLEAQRSGEVTILLDGTKYRLDVYSGQDHLAMEVVGSEVDGGDAPDELPLVRSMNLIRRQVQNLIREKVE